MQNVKDVRKYPLEELLKHEGAILDYFEKGYDMSDIIGIMLYIRQYYLSQTMILVAVSRYIADVNYRCRIYSKA